MIETLLQLFVGSNSPRPVIAAKTAEDLDWPALLAELADRCESEAGPVCIENLPQMTDPTLIASRMSQVSAAAVIIAAESAPSIRGLVDVPALVDRALRGGTLDGLALRAIGVACDIGDDVQAFFEESTEPLEGLLPLAQGLQLLTWLSNPIADAIEPDGSIAADATPELKSLRRHSHQFKERLQKIVERYLRDPDHEEVVQDEFYTYREGRYVVPIKVSKQSEVGGIVHGRSRSGQTVFVEPQDMVDLNNQLMVARMAVEEEEERILAQLTALVGKASEPLLTNYRCLVFLDITLAAARLSIDMRATAPDLDEEGRVGLKSARHPMLALRETRTDGAFRVVANDLPLEQPVLVISGPNTGGKTVMLKTLGLFALMVRAGLPIPVDPGSTFPVFQRVFSDIGDEQSLADNLSSFSAHLGNIRGFLRQIVPGTLVLLDEVFSGTDPIQGAALATALLDELAEQGAMVCVTTHFEGLKQAALARDRFDCAAMGFDLASMEPTYRLTIGLPGSSYAVGIARRYGLPDSILRRAERELSGERGDEVEAMLEELERQRSKLETQGQALKDARREAAEEKRRYQRERERLKQAALESVDSELQDLFAQVREAEVLLKKRRREISAGAIKESRAAEIAADLKAVKTRLRVTIDHRERREVAAERSPLDPTAINTGDAVFVRTFKQIGTVVEIDGHRGQCTVRLGSMKASVSIPDLFAPTRQEIAQRNPPRKTPRAPDGPAEAASVPQTAQNTLDLRGKRVDEALEELEKYLDKALGRNERGVYVIHGHGTGALKSAIRDQLARSPYAKAWRPADRFQGGDGVTAVDLA
jgi:DNA mismatch repair protein MutS2